MELYFLGCRCAAPAVPKYMHTSFAIEINDVIYWFDAGEGCSHTAHLMGIDLLRVKEIFISHPHMDHIGGLANLLWNIRKLTKYRKQLPMHGDIGVHISDLEVWDGLWMVLKNTEELFKWKCRVKPSQIKGGYIYRDENITVYAVHNRHMEKYEDQTELSFSFKIRCEDKSIVYSGDIKDLSDLDALLEEPCDYLLVETAHQKVEAICAYADKKDVRTLMFLHHSLEIMKNMQQARMSVTHGKCNIYFAQDGDRLTL